MTTASSDDRLLPGERVVWQGQPARGLLFTRRDVVLIPISLVWSGFAVSWVANAVTMRLPSIGYVWGTLFVVSSIYILVVRFIIDAWLRRRTSYTITDRRVLIERAPPFGALTVIPRTSLSSIDLTPIRSDQSTIVLGSAGAMRGHRGMVGWIPVLDATPQLFAISNARHVFDLLQQSDPDAPAVSPTSATS